MFGVSCLAVLCVLGCGDDTGLSKRYPVSGTVTYNGSKVAKGRINFIPVKSDQGRPAAGDIEDGYYSLTTAEANDGAIPGSYNVTISALDVDISAGKTAPGAGQQFAQSKAAAKAVKAAKALVPLKYSSVDTSKLTADVKESSNKFDFELKD
jgi:hypothetical protein